jgi:hypothetical protein
MPRCPQGAAAGNPDFFDFLKKTKEILKERIAPGQFFFGGKYRKSA